MTTDTIITTSDTPNTAGFVSSRLWLLWSGIAALCAWVLVPIYLVALGALGGRQGVYIWTTPSVFRKRMKGSSDMPVGRPVLGQM
ncbi:hypothetical protein ACC687_38980, partial [Rhizobium ruizarguesonis]